MNRRIAYSLAAGCLLLGVITGSSALAPLATSARPHPTQWDAIARYRATPQDALAIDLDGAGGKDHDTAWEHVA